MKLSIVIISWNSLPMLRACMAALGESLARPETELIWVDNGSTDHAADWMERWIADHGTDAKIIRLDRNRGVAYARNRGVEAATGDYVLFLDDDTEPTVRALEAMTDYVRSRPKVGICGVALRDREGNLQRSFKDYPGLGAKLRNVFRSLLGMKEKVTAPAKPTEICYVIGACQLVRREVFDRIGLLDESIFYGPEDADFCIRAREAGYVTVYLPSVSIMHHWRRATSRRLLSPLGRKHIAALFHFYRKHRRWL